MPSDKPFSVRLSLWLFVGPILLGPLISRIFLGSWAIFIDVRFPVPPWRALVMISPFIALYVFIVVRAYGGRSWARSALLVLWVIGVAMTFPQHLNAFRIDSGVSLLELAEFSIDAASMALLYVPASNAWYRSCASASAAT